MPLKQLDHVNVRTANLDAMVSWYRDILGMQVGDRPQFSFPGAWMYVGDQAVIHLVGVVDGNPVPVRKASSSWSILRCQPMG